MHPRGSGAAVAHHLAKVRVAGSNPVFRSIVFRSIVFRSIEAPGQCAPGQSEIGARATGNACADSTIQLHYQTVSGPRNASKGRAKTSDDRRRRKGSGGIVEVADDTWKVDIELPRDAVTGRRRRVSRTIRGRVRKQSLLSRAYVWRVMRGGCRRVALTPDRSGRRWSSTGRQRRVAHSN